MLDINFDFELDHSKKQAFSHRANPISFCAPLHLFLIIDPWILIGIAGVFRDLRSEKIIGVTHLLI
jgi:hypothetical protein